MSTIYLRVKINSLTEEAKIIRREEHRRRYQKVKGPDGKIYKRRVVTSDQIFWGLRTHRPKSFAWKLAQLTWLTPSFAERPTLRSKKTLTGNAQPAANIRQAGHE